MKHTAIDLATHITAGGLRAMTEQERTEMTAELISLNGLKCGRVLAVLPTDTPEIWYVSCMQDGAMDALATYKMDVRTGRVFNA